MVYDIFESMRQMQREMDRAFAQFFDDNDTPLLASSDSQLPTSYQRPLADVKDTDDEFVVTLDIPGMNKEDIHIDVDENTLSVSAQRNYESETDEDGVYRRERRYAGYKRAFPLPNNAQSTQADAEYVDGVLTISVPKDKTKNAQKRIEVK